MHDIAYAQWENSPSLEVDADIIDVEADVIQAIEVGHDLQAIFSSL